MTEISTEYYTSSIPRIDEEEKSFWMDALASDKYKDRQGLGQLETLEGDFCCLGVYADAKDTPKCKKLVGFSDAIIYGKTESLDPLDYSWTVLPPIAQINYKEATLYVDPVSNKPSSKFFGGEALFYTGVQGKKENFELFGPEMGGEMVPFTLPYLNDSEQFSFAQIRDIINYFL